MPNAKTISALEHRAPTMPFGKHLLGELTLEPHHSCHIEAMCKRQRTISRCIQHRIDFNGETPFKELCYFAAASVLLSVADALMDDIKCMFLASNIVKHGDTFWL
jgi:hypothetical protein